MSKKKETKLSKYMKLPIKMMMKARNLYIQSMNQLSSHDLGGAMAFGVPTVSHVNALQRSFSTSQAQSSTRAKDDRVAALVRAASARNATIDVSYGVPSKLEKAKSVAIPARTIDASYGVPSKLEKAKSVAVRSHDGLQKFERIDESSPLIIHGSKKKNMFQKSKSYSVTKYSHALH